MKKTLLLTALVFAVILVCAKKQVPQDALIKVGDKYITAKEFRYRGEFTPHPTFPRANKNLEKVLLNNLIMEKLFVMEYGQNSELSQNKNFQSYIQGIKEQKMREKLFYDKAFNAVNLDSSEVQKRFVLSQREYNLEFYSIRNDSIARVLRDKVQAHPDSAVQIFDHAWDTDQRPSWTVKWKDPDHVNIHEALYAGPLAQDSVIGPIPLNHGQWIMMKVVDWKDVLLMGGQDAELRHKEVIEKVTMNKATLAWDAYMRDVMKGKSIEFDRDVFIKLANLTFDLETANDNVEKSSIMQRFWQEEDSTLTIADLPSEEAFLRQPFFTIDGVTWTVGDFRQAVASHPLVYRNSSNSRGEFFQQFKMAVADLVRDSYLNKEAYAEKLDKDVEVQRTVEMWEDAMIAAYERDKAVARVGKAFPDTTDPYRQTNLQKAFNAHLDSLRAKYSDNIAVNQQEFEKLELSNVQLFVMQNQVPFPIAMPTWPLFWTNNSVDYKALKAK